MSTKLKLETETSDISKGHYGMIKILSTGEHRDRIYTDIKDLRKEMAGRSVWIRARLQSSKATSNQCFVILRQSFNTVQLIISTNTRQVSQQLVKFTSNITKESIVDVFATVLKITEPFEACSLCDVELVGEEVWVVSSAKAELPFQLEHASRPETDDPDVAIVSLETRLDNRVLDLRTPTNQAVFRIQAGICRLFRESLTRKGFFEIHVPKISTGSLFDSLALSYFNTTAYLGVTLQFHKQVSIAADFDKVFTIGSVFRPEKFNTYRHLTEFVGLDLEMAFKHHYHEVLDVIGETFIDIFHGLRDQYAAEIAMVARQFDVEPFKFVEPALRLEFPQAVQILKEAGVIVHEEEELSIPHEKLLGKLVRDKYDTDFFILDKYPTTVSRFWVMHDAHNPKATNGYDMFMRGEEVLSGCQRIHDPVLLLEKAKLTEFDLKSLSFYLDSFKYGCPPHAGGGIGLERTVMLYLGLDDIRRASMFPRDPTRITP